MNRPDLMIFEPNLGGHHAEFTCHLLKHWIGAAPHGKLLAAVAPGLLEQQPALSKGAIQPPQTERAPLTGPLPGTSASLWVKGLRNRRLLTDAIKKHRPKRVLIMYMDHAQMGLALGLRFPFPVRISGILFHPTLHYPAARSFNPKAHLQRLRKRWLLQLVARNRHLDTVFTLDASAVPSLKALGLRAVALADPVGPGNVDARTPQEMKRLHGIDPDRKVLLLFGALTARKGVVPMLKSVAMLPPWAARQVALLMAGPLDPALRPQVSLLSSGARAAGVQVVHHDAYIQSGSAQPFMEAADLVLAPYQRHFGSSAVLVRAARAQRPVLSQEFGLMGANVRDYGLGQCVDTADPGAIAAGIETFLNEPGSGYDRQRSAGFVQANTPDRFCRTLLSHLLPPESSL